MKLNKHLVVAMLIGLLALPAVSISHPIFHPVAVKADVYTIVHDAFLKHGARKVGTADDMGVKSPIYEVIRNGQKVDWDSGDVTVKINGHDPKQNSNGDALNPMLKLVDSSNQYDNSLSRKSSESKVSNSSKNKMKSTSNKTKNKAPKNNKSKTNSNGSKSNNSNKPVKNNTKRSSHKNIGLIVGIVVIIIVILGIIGGVKRHNKERYY